MLKAKEKTETAEEIFAKMNLKTEADYWWAIEGIGGLMHFDARLVARGELESKDVADSQVQRGQLQLFVVQKLSEKFDIILPDDPRYPQGVSTWNDDPWPAAPFGKRWYGEWYQSVKQEIHEYEYSQLICSACPYSQGLAAYNRRDTDFPCSLVSGWCRIHDPSHCCQTGLTYSNSPSELFRLGKPAKALYTKARDTASDIGLGREKLLAKMRDEHGAHTVLAFRKHERRLKRLVQLGLVKRSL